MHPDFSAAKIEKKSAQITRANTVYERKVDFLCSNISKYLSQFKGNSVNDFDFC